MNGKFENHLNGQLFCDAVARIMGEQCGAQVTATALLKEQVEDRKDDLTA